MIRRPPRSTRTDTLFPYTTLFRSTLASRDAAAAPVIDPGFLTDARDMVTLRAGVRMMHRIAAAPPLSDYAGVDRHPVDLEDDAALDAMIRRRADTVRSEERRVGQECASTCRSRWWPYHEKKKTQITRYTLYLAPK